MKVVEQWQRQQKAGPPINRDGPGQDPGAHLSKLKNAEEPGAAVNRISPEPFYQILGSTYRILIEDPEQHVSARDTEGFLERQVRLIDELEGVYQGHGIEFVVIVRQVFGKPIIHYDKYNAGAAAYELLAQEVLARLDG